MFIVEVFGYSCGYYSNDPIMTRRFNTLIEARRFAIRHDRVYRVSFINELDTNGRLIDNGIHERIG